MTHYRGNLRQRDIVWLEVMYSDYSETKDRPTLIISNDGYNRTHREIICCVITSSPDRVDYIVPIDNSHLENGRFTKRNKVRYDYILRVDKDLVRRKHGKLNKTKSKEVIDKIIGLIEVEN